VKHSLTLDSIFSFLESQSITVDADCRLKLNSYLSLITTWSGRVNLISRRDVPFLLHRHFLPCMWLSLHKAFPPSSSILDIGSGGGLPGVIVQIMSPDSRVVLLDSIRKKTLFLSEVCRHLPLPSEVVCERIESYMLFNRGTFDFIVCRAVAKIDLLWGWSEHLLKPGGFFLAMKGGECNEELSWLQNKKVHYEQIFAANEWIKFSPFLKDKHIIKIRRGDLQG
jgi:16S rRNA (guanine527-N7)-methyltransferase